jgi:trans-aconitate methyltransferase
MFEAQERQRLEGAAQKYSTYGGAEGRCIEYGFDSIRPWFKGEACLELGPADGQLTSLLRNDFKSVISVEGSETFAQTLRSTLGETDQHRIVCSLFEEYVPNEQADTIVAARIMEHVDDPQGLYQRMKSWISPGASLIVQVPNALSFHRLLGVKLGLMSDPHDLNERDHMLGHRRIYDHVMLEKELRDAGWKVQAFKGCFFKLLSNQQMDDWLSPEVMNGLDALGADFPDNASIISALCTL